jgi:hypothetical protein
MRECRSEYQANVRRFSCATVAPSYHDTGTQHRGLVRTILALATCAAVLFSITGGV